MTGQIIIESLFLAAGIAMVRVYLADETKTWRAIIAALLLTAGIAVAQDDEEWASGVGQCDQVTKGLVSYWGMRNSGTTVFDEVGENNGNATVSPDFVRSAGVVSVGADYTSTNKTINVPSSASLNFGDGSFTISIWFNRRVVGVNVAVISKRTGSNGAGYGMQIRNDNHKIEAWVEGSNGSTTELTSGTAFGSTNTWMHVVFIRDTTADTLSLYVDSDLDAGPTADGTTASISVTNNLEIGSQTPATGPVSKQFRGFIDEVRIYSRAITANEVKQLYRMGKVIYENR